MKQKKIVLINDLSGFGRCSLSVWIPILSVMKNECLLLPTALLSAHTAYPGAVRIDLAQDMEPWAENWKDLSVIPDAVFSGYIANEQQGRGVVSAIDRLRKPETMVLVDPAMGDDGVLYSGLNASIVDQMREIVSKADIILPNLTEACLLCKTDPHQILSKSEITRLAQKLMKMGPRSVIITGIPFQEEQFSWIFDGIFEKDREPVWIRSKKEGTLRAGTGDVFGAVFAGMVVNGHSVEESVQSAGDFVRRGLQLAQKMDIDPREGIPFEYLLKSL